MTHRSCRPEGAAQIPREWVANIHDRIAATGLVDEGAELPRVLPLDWFPTCGQKRENDRKRLSSQAHPGKSTVNHSNKVAIRYSFAELCDEFHYVPFGSDLFLYS